MRTATDWFDLYGESHKNPLNKAIHWVCIPAIVWATLGLFQAIPIGGPFFHVGTVIVLAALAFYIRLSRTLFAGMALVSGTALAVNAWLAIQGVNLFAWSAGVFFVAWLFQFIGHKIEGKKPSFFQDLQFLLIGPAWLLQFVYRQVGIPVENRQEALREATIQ